MLTRRTKAPGSDAAFDGMVSGSYWNPIDSSAWQMRQKLVMPWLHLARQRPGGELKGVKEVWRVVSPPGGNAAFVGEVAGDAAFVAQLGTANEGGVEDEAVLWSVAPGLQSPEQSLLRSKDLHCTGWVLGQIGQRACKHG